MRTIKKASLIPILCLCFCLIGIHAFAAQVSPDKGTAADSGSREQSLQDLQGEVQHTMNEMISITGGLLSGMAAGMQEGAENAQRQLDGADGTKLVANKKDLEELLQLRFLKAERLADFTWHITVAVKNANDYPVRLVNLTRKQSALLLDVDGFAHEQSSQEGQPRTLDVPSRASVKATFVFAGLEAKPNVLRLFDMDVDISASKALDY